MVSILFLAADPTNASRLRLGEEAREIEEKLRMSRHAANFNFETKWSVRPHDISQALLDLNPQVVHFSGHGQRDGALLVENYNGKMQTIDPEALGDLFENFAGVVECVILNACFSATQAEAIARHVPYVIGMHTSIDDRSSIAFTIGFYQALGAGKLYDQAFKMGLVMIRMQGFQGHLIPVMIKEHDLAALDQPGPVQPVSPGRIGQEPDVTARTAEEISKKRDQEPASAQRQPDALLRELIQMAVELGIDAEDVTYETRLGDDLGMDSLDMVEMIMMVEDRYNIEITDEDAQRIQTVGDGVEFLRGRL